MRFQTFYEGRWIFVVLLALLAICAWVYWPLALVPVLLIAFSIWFFRDPERAIPGKDDDVVAAADGRVTEVVEVEVPELGGAKMKRIGIFLSVFDVHVNRAPLAGRVLSSVEKVGEYLDARHPEAETRNACRIWIFERLKGVGRATDVSTEEDKFMVKQITGAIARRIVPWSVVGDVVERGGRFGMIRFGSRTEIFLPLSAEISVSAGDHVKGGLSRVARLAAKTEVAL